jgi:hypothetical protein
VPSPDRGIGGSRLHGQGRPGVPAVHCRQGHDPVQRSGSLTDAAASGRQPGEDDRRSEPDRAGSAGYFGFSQWRELSSLDSWIRRSDGGCVASSGSSGRRASQHYHELRRLKVPKRSASASSGSAFHGRAGECLIRRTAVVRPRMPGNVGGVASRDVPLSRLRWLAASVMLSQGEGPC